jgi:hypothetical protein
MILSYEYIDHAYNAIIDVKACLDTFNFDFENECWGIWGEGTVYSSDILNRYCTEDTFKSYQGKRSLEDHAQRVRNLMACPILKPIDLEISQYGQPTLEDGCHRIYASYLRGDKTIKAKVFGFIDYIPDLMMER